MKPKDEDVKKNIKQEALHYFHHGKLKISEIAEKLGKSPRTVYRWLNGEKKPHIPRQQESQTSRKRRRQYSDEILARIVQLKSEYPKRSARIIRSLLESEHPSPIPSETTIRRILVEKGMGRIAAEARKGYITFERERPNELWQIDIAGVQTVAHLGPLYLFALIDDCSRFIPAAFYAENQKGTQVMRLLQLAIVDHGRPLAILADNGTQFRNVLSNLESKYEKLLHLLDIKPVYARVRHPQTKGKLERFFGTVKSMFLSEARFQAKQHPDWTLTDFNHQLQEWLEFYNNKHRHRSLPNRSPPAKIYFHKVPRVNRPLEIVVDWDMWIREVESRKVSKTNFISFRGNRFTVPLGYAGLKVSIWITGNTLEIHRNNQCLVSYILKTPILDKKGPQTRRIAQSGTIGYRGKYYSISYKMAGQQVTVKESADGTILLIYSQGQLIKQLPK
ncbi:MAG: DDE-type integrase/transposase/recombinase [Promethearchaeota archaeon]